MVAKPADLSRKSWAKLKPLTMKKTQFGEVLDAYAKALDQAKKTPSKDEFAKVTKALEQVKAKLTFARQVAEQGKHKDLLEGMKEYNNLIAKAATDITNEQGKYLKKIGEWVKIRTDCIAGMTQHEKTMDQVTKKIAASVSTVSQSTGGTGDVKFKKASQGLGKQALAELEAFRKKYIETCNQVRTPQKDVSIHANDRDTKYLEQLNGIMARMEAEYRNAEGSLQNALKKLEASMAK